jgi:hypothetical protein
VDVDVANKVLHISLPETSVDSLHSHHTR